MIFRIKHKLVNIALCAALLSGWCHVGVARAQDTIHVAADSLARPIYPSADTAVAKPIGRAGAIVRQLPSWANATMLSAPLVVEGLLIRRQDTHFRKLRDDYAPHFKHGADNLLQYAPAVAMYGMKAMGVKSRDSWGRMLTAHAMSWAVMGGVVNALKYTVRSPRPDGSTNNSFPSGHTATAFMAAAMLDKEYGHVSPWVGVGAYGVATATGLMRMANNRHWLSDVMVGAGVGILSTEAGYALADLLLGRSQDNDTRLARAPRRFDRPSFFSVCLGLNVPLSKYDIDERHAFTTTAGCSAGVEGAYYFSPYIGAGGRLAVSNSFIINENNNLEDNTFHALTLMGGGYFSYPLSSRVRLGGKLLGGYVRYPELTIGGHVLPTKDGACYDTGAWLTLRESTHYGIRLFADYLLLPPHSRMSTKYIHMMVWGTAFAVNF
ncbi:phosphatase PAP2 family protein [Hallella colorans]|uniref:phosphatase PAP2 family protein n=1 Tax=Hallella colorans TaxID=1703337 RepID=UPI0023F21D0F|nr:phosphatase PAP2 family protein [Hallella colorans]